MIGRQRYETWQKWHSQFSVEVASSHHDWIAKMSSILSEIERDCPDGLVKGHARRCREFASEFRNSKSDAKITRAYEQFLGSWQRLGDAIGMHLLETPKPSIASRLRSSFASPPRIPRNDPSSSQTVEMICEYYRAAKIGDAAAIRQTHGSMLYFRMTQIENIKGPRLYLKVAADYGGVAFYIKSGKNCRSPTGQSGLVIPTPEVAAWIERNPSGTIDWR